MLADSKIMQAITSIPARAEKRLDAGELVNAYVDAGILPHLENNNSMIVYGRRGTGKTHLFTVLASRYVKQPDNLAVYIDSRKLGSTAQFSDVTLPLGVRCFHLFQDILRDIHDELLRFPYELEGASSADVVDALEELAFIMVGAINKAKSMNVTRKNTASQHRDGQLSLGFSPKGPDATLKSGGGKESTEETSTSYDVRIEEKIVFPDLHRVLDRILKPFNKHLYLLLDEWSSIPIDLQPYLAEFIKRGFIPNPRITVKIASLEHRSKFSVRSEHSIVGFEVGADISASLDIDDYYVYDRNPDEITKMFGDILYRHMSTDIEKYISDEYNVHSGAEMVSRLFTTDETFRELVRAAEGVVRDLINLFITAAMSARKFNRERIDKKAVIEAARQWYEQDKVKELSDDLRLILERIIGDVIGTRRARSFLVPRTLQDHPVVRRLFDARVLHLMRRGYAAKDNPGVRYDIYNLDYGTYVDLLATSRAPDISLKPVGDETQEDVVVPFADNRSIRRILLSAEILEV